MTSTRLSSISAITRRVVLLGVVAATMLLGAAVTGSVASAATSGCALTSTGGTITRTLGTRAYELHVPAGLTGTSVPLLLSLHGAGSNGVTDESFTGWSTFADAHGFIVAYPDARPNYGGGVWDPYTTGSADVSFARQVVGDVSAKWCVDPKRVYVDGWSNGAVMSQRVACDAADLFAAATSYAGGSPVAGGAGAPCRPTRPISVGLIAGQFDFTYATLAQNASEWLGYDGCATTASHTSDAYGATDSYACPTGTGVFARVVNNTSHNWPSGAQGEDQRSRMWAFFAAHPLP